MFALLSLLLRQVTPMFLVWLLPRNKKEQQELQKSSAASSLGGKVFLWVAGLSILFTIVEAIVELIEYAS